VKKCFYIPVLILFSLFSCQTLPKENPKCIYLMIYDYENNAIKDVVIKSEKNQIGKTDIYGRFIITDLDSIINYKLAFEKPGYERIEYQLDENKHDEVIYIKMGSGFYYATMAENFYDNGDYIEAKQYINKALEIENRKDYLFLNNIIGLENENN